MSTSVTNIQNRLHSGEYGVNIVAFSNEIATPTNPSDLEHSTFTRLSDINDDFDYRIRNLNNSINDITETESGIYTGLYRLESGYYWTTEAYKLAEKDIIQINPHVNKQYVAFSVSQSPLDTPSSTITDTLEYSAQSDVYVRIGFSGTSTETFSYTILRRSLNGNLTKNFVSYTKEQSLTSELQQLVKLNLGIGPVVIEDGSITTAKLHDSAVTGGKLAEGAVTALHLDSNSVTTSKLANGAVTGAKIAEGTITSENLAPGIEIPYDITDGSITTAKLANNAVTTAKIADSSVTNAKIADGAISSNKLDSSLASTISGKLDASSAFSGDYSDLTNKPTIPTVPTNISAFTNDEGYLTSSDLSDVAYLGNYPGSAVIPDFDPHSDCLRVDSSLELSSTKSQNAKSNMLNKNAAAFTVDGGYSIKYFKQNIVSGENVLTLNDFSDNKTVYVIDYDFKIDGSTYTSSNPLVLPSDSILLFLSGGFYGGGYIDLNDAEVYPSYNRLYKILDTSVSPSRNPVNIIGGIKEGTVWYDDTEKKVVTYNGNSIVYADGIIYGDSFSKTTQSLPNWNTDVVKYPIGYMYYYSGDLYVITGYTTDANNNPNGYIIEYVGLTSAQ